MKAYRGRSYSSVCCVGLILNDIEDGPYRYEIGRLGLLR